MFAVVSRVGAQRAGRHGRGRVVLLGLDVGEAVRVSGGRDTSLDVLRLEGLRARVDLEALHDRRVDRSDHQARDDEQGACRSAAVASVRSRR